MNKLYISLLGTLLFALASAYGQESLEVTRSNALPWGSPVQNIFVDADNTKWAANTETIKKVLGAQSAQPLNMGPGEVGLFQFPGGNADIRWQPAALRAAIGDILDRDNRITAAFYDEVNQDIWLGTSLTGAYRLKQEEGRLVFKEQLSIDNTKLRSNYIHDIERDAKGRIWIATDDGALLGKGGGKWEVLERGLIIESIAVAQGEVWMMGDGLIGKVNRRDTWDLIDLPSNSTEGRMRDIALDGQGRLWIASAVITVYNPEDQSVKVFGGAEEYTSEFANRLVVDLDGAVWIGTEDKGVYVIQKGSSLVASVEMVSTVSCEGDGKDGALRVQVSGGTPPFTYEWTGGASGERPSGLAPGNYQLTITDSKGKQRETAVSIPDRRVQLTVEATQQVSGEGQEDGVAQASAKGGLAPYTYAWDNGETGERATKLSEGEHTLTVTDRDGCAVTASVQISRILDELAVSIEQVRPIRCYGNKSAVLKAVPAGGAAPYTYQWSVADAPTPQLTGLLAGDYALTLTDANGTKATATFTVEEPPAFSATAKAVGAASTGGSDGQASAQPEGGVAPYTYAWENGATGQTAKGLSAGWHGLTITDANGCEATAEVEISEDILPMAVRLEQVAPVSCESERDAALAATVEGGKPPYVYTWGHDALNAPKTEGLGQGTYTLTVTDAAQTAATASFEVGEPEKLKITANIRSSANVGATDGVAEVAAQGGTPPYAIAWQDGSTADRREDLATGLYTVAVKDARGCDATITFEVSEDILPLQVSLSATQAIACAGAAEGAIAAQVSGGKGPFTYAWSASGQSAAEAKGLAAGSYSLTVTDAVGSTAEANLDLVAPAALTAKATALQSASTDASDGVGEVQAQGGTAPYSYAWSTGASTAKAEGLPPGAHTVTVTDANGCTATAEVEITEDILPLQVSLSASQAIACAGAAEGAIAAQVSGGKGPFTYAWSESGQSAAEAKGLAAGSYSLTVTDAVGAKAEASLDLAEPVGLTAKATALQSASTDASDGVGEVQAQGGTAPYGYAWSTGASTAKAEGLPPGAHTVTVTDAKGCTATAELNITEDILPLQVSLSATQTIDCAGDAEGAIAAQVSGGKGPFTYAWSASGQSAAEAKGLAAGSYGLTVTDAVGTKAEANLDLAEPVGLTAKATALQSASTDASDGVGEVQAQGGTAPYRYAWSTGASTAKAEGLPPGAHTVTVTDANGCTATAEVEITEDILPLQVSLSASQTIACAGAAEGAIAAQVSGGKGPFTYAWSAPGQSAAEAKGLAAGSYGLTVTDAVGTKAEANIDLAEPVALTAKATALQSASTDASDGVGEVQAQGGTAPYGYAWSTGTSTAKAEGLPPGAHTVTVTDANGCTATAELNITEDILPLQVSLSASQTIACAGAAEGAIAAQVSGGKGPFTYAWSASGQSAAEAKGLAAGSYGLTVTDAVGTKAEANLDLAEPVGLTAKGTALQSASTDASDGVGEVQAQGGTAPYGYAWSTGASTAKAEGLPPGAHTVTVTDANGCTAIAELNITEDILPLQLQVELSQAISCAGEADAALQAVIKGGKGPFQYKWSAEGLNGEAPSNLAPDTYELTVVDALGTSASASIIIAELSLLRLEVTKVEPAMSDTSEDGKAEAEASGGTPPYAFAWSNGSTGKAVERLGLGNYELTVTDANGCQASAAVEITERVIKELTGAISSGQTIQMQKLQFDADSVNIKDEVRPILNEIYLFLTANSSAVVEIGGHTNDLPPDEYCDQLSTARAKAVAEFLVAKGIPSERVFFKGYGKRKPLFSNRTEDGRRRNQRVEIKILRI